MTEQTKVTITPGLSYDDAPAAIEWLCRVFGFRSRLVVPGPDDTIVHSELSLGDAVIMLGSARPEQGRLSPRSLDGVTQALCVAVDDPDAHFEVTKSAGAEILQELEDTEYGACGYMVKDLEGHHWYFGNYSPGEFWED